MHRISNRQHPNQVHVAPKVHYIEREVSVLSEPQIIETQVEKLVEVPVDRIVEIEKLVEVPVKVDLSGIHAHISKHEQYLMALQAQIDRNYGSIFSELEMQRRALVAIKAQRDVDRKRRLQLIMRLKKQRDEQKVWNLRCKLVMGTSLLLSILSLLIK